MTVGTRWRKWRRHRISSHITAMYYGLAHAHSADDEAFFRRRIDRLHAKSVRLS